MVFAGGCQSSDAELERETALDVSSFSFALDQPVAEPTLGKIFDAELVDGKRQSVTVVDLPDSAYQRDTEPRQPKSGAVNAPTPDAVGPRLRQDVDAVRNGSGADRSVEVVVTFKEDLQVPRFPALIEDEGRDFPENQAALEQARLLVSSLVGARAQMYENRGRELAAQFGAKELERFWLINGMTLALPLAAVDALSRRGDVQHVEYRQSANMRPVGSVADARGIMRSDAYFSGGGYIGLLDSGVRASHTLLSTNLGFVRDCISNTDANCATGTDTNDTCNHGTASAAVISGNANLGNASRGVSGLVLDSFKTGLGCGVDIAATVRGYQAAIAVLDRVIVDENQDGGSETGAVATAADAAFDAGAVVVSAAGNFGPGTGTVSSPGKAHKVLAIGAIDTPSLALQGYSGRGPTADGRIKPDLLAPTNVNSASNSSDTALFTYTGTSAATPHGAGAAALVRNFLRGASFEIAPGLVNAFMILSGDRRAFDNNNGAGIVRLPQNGHLWWGSVTVTNGQIVNVPLNIGTPTTSVNASIWWPEGTTVHNDVDLTLLRPNGTTADSSVSVNSIFEKVRTTSTLSSGTWTLRVRGFSVTGSQVVYYALHRL